MTRRLWLFGLTVVLLASLGMACSGGDKSKANAKAADAALAKGLAAHKAGNTDEATADYREALRLDPKNKLAYYNLGVIEQNAKHMEDAETDYRHAINIDPKFSAALYNLGIIRNTLGAPDEAIDLYKQVLAIDDTNVNAHLNLAGLLRIKGQTAESDAQIKRAVELNPKLTSPGVAAPILTVPGASTPTTAPAPSTPAKP